MTFVSFLADFCKSLLEITFIFSINSQSDMKQNVSDLNDMESKINSTILIENNSVLLRDNVEELKFVLLIIS